MSIQLFFSDFFDVPPDAVADWGAVDISLVNDIPLFIDPFLLFNSEDPKYHALHEEIIKYVTFLRDKAAAGTIQKGLLREWFCFPEVKQLWLGFSLAGNDGSGLGMDFAAKLHKNLHTIFQDFGDEEVTEGSHIEKLCLIEAGVGKDNISDFTANLIKHFLVKYTREFAEKHIAPQHLAKHFVEKVSFNYATESWESKEYLLPTFGGDYVLLAPRDLLRKDETWINRHDLVGQFEEVRDSIENDILRAKVNNYFLQRIPPVKVTNKDRREAASATIHKFPELVEYFIRLKEATGEKAVAVSAQEVQFTQRRFIDNVRKFAALLQETTQFFLVEGGTKDEARVRVDFLKDVIENKGGWQVFYVCTRMVMT